MRKVAAAIIAGGPARRLGGAVKPLLEIRGQTIADRQLAVLRPLFERVFAVANDPTPWAVRDVEVVGDRVVGAGPLAGVAAALAAAGGAEAVVCVAGDLPFLVPALLVAVRDRAPDAPALAARPGGRAEPLCARYSAALGAEVEARLADERLALHELLGQSGAVWLTDADLGALDPGRLSFLNVNTPDDLRRAEEIARWLP
ncbi:MAG TPA: NTP transferase domain-containing protein [Polyangia bacterium]|jgi:molybdopterin-guanine dinucleotide biosynthesis protein A